jgi:TolA-binding protein
MNTNKVIITSCFFLLVVFSNAQRAYQFDSADRLFIEGKDFFELKNYAGCIDKFEEYKKTSQNRDLVQEVDYILAFIEFEQGKETVSTTLNTFLEKYPDTPKRDMVYFMLGTKSFENADYVKAESLFALSSIAALDLVHQEEMAYRLAYCQMNNNNYPTALVNFETVRELGEKYNKASTYYIAYIDYATGKYDEAKREFGKISRDLEFREQANYYLAQINFIEDNYEEVIKLTDRLLRTYPDSENNTELYRIAGNSYYQLNNQVRAVSMLNKYVASTDNPSISELYILGVCNFNIQEYQKAIDALSRTIKEEDGLTQNASLYLGYCYLKLDDKNNARMAFEHAADMKYNKKVQETALYNYALIIHETSFTGFGESVKIFERFLNDFPNSQYADIINDYLVEVYLTSKNYPAALESINKIRRPTTKILEAKQNILFQLGNQSFMNQDYNMAATYFDEAISMGSYDVEARANSYFWKGESNYRLENYTAAISDFNSYQTALKQDYSSENPLVYYNLGYCFFKRRDLNNALISFRRFVSLSDRNEVQLLADTYTRIGDCLFNNRQYGDAETNYTRAVSLQPSFADYATYQKGFMQGLMKDYKGKIGTMDNLIRDYPSSQYIDDAMFERGRSYVLLDNYSSAASSFTSLMEQFPQSSLAPKAGVQLGLLYYNDNKPERSIDVYKKVIRDYPGSEEAKVAVQDLKSVYIDLNDISSYATYVNSLSGTTHIEASEQDSLTYLAAEKQFIRGDMENAGVSMTNYLKSYPNGAFSSNASFYLAKIAFGNKNYSEAKRLFTNVLNGGDPKFREEALARKSEIEYLDKDYKEAINTFRELQTVAESQENRLAAKLGIMRCAQFTGDENEALDAANELLKEAKLSPEVEREARYLRGKLYRKLGNNKKAIEDFKALSKDSRTEYGAESKFLLAQIYYDNKDLSQSEKELTDFIEKGTPHQYWLARSFILLADIYIDKGDDFQARQYLTSLKRNYSGNEEIDSMIENRLNKLNKE